MSIAVLALLLPLQLAVPLKQDDWVLHQHYPGAQRGRRNSGMTKVAVSIDPAGKVIECRLASSSGHAELDRRACAAILVRAKFEPARDEHGRAVASLWMQIVSWQIYGERQKHGSALDRIFTVTKLPGNDDQASLSVRIRTNADGKIEHCEIDEGSGNIVLDRIACPTLVKSGPIEVARDESANSLATVRSVKIQFVVVRP